MFKILMIIFFALLGIWAAYSFDTLWMRYFLSNLFAYPVKTISLTLCLILLILIFYLILVAGFIGPITNQVNAIEPAIEEFKNHNIKIDSIRLAVTSEYVAIYERLKPSDKKHSVEEYISKFMKDSRFLYKNCPSVFNSAVGFSKNYDMSGVTQVTALRIEKFKHTFLFFTHNLNEPDQKLIYLKYEDLPNNKALHQILDPVFEDEVLDNLRMYFEDGLSKGLIVDSYKYEYSSQNPGEWTLIGVPDPFNRNNYLSNLLRDAVWLNLAEAN